jgi:hypothetical protein
LSLSAKKPPPRLVAPISPDVLAELQRQSNFGKEPSSEVEERGRTARPYPTQKIDAGVDLLKKPSSPKQPAAAAPPPPDPVVTQELSQAQLRRRHRWRLDWLPISLGALGISLCAIAVFIHQRPLPGAPAATAAPAVAEKGPAPAEAVAEPAAVAPEAGVPQPEQPEPAAKPMDPEDVARAIAQDKGEAIQLCYEKELRRTPTLSGRLTVTLDLVPPHTVEKVSVRDSLRRPAFTTCVRRAMRTIAFPEIREELTLEIPFDLKSPAL